jgi:hypothetical protein
MNQRQKCSGDGGLRFTAVAALSSLSSVTPPSPDRLISVQVPRMKKRRYRQQRAASALAA